jgi:hypothetical protein
VYPVAHIGNIPVEEWLPFLVPVVALYLVIRRRERRRRDAVSRLPGPSELLDEHTVELVLARWAQGRHPGARARHLPLLYPPGPDGMTVAELAARAGCDLATVERLLAELEDLGYVELDGEDGPEQTASLTIEGHDLVNQTESALLAAAREHAPRAAVAPDRV